MVDNQAEIQQPETDDIDADLRNAIEELKVEAPQESRVVIDKQDRARDETGKFTEAAKEAQPKRETLTIPEKSDVNATSTTTEVIAPQKATLPDWMGWKGQSREKFHELPDWARAEILKREEDAHKALSRQDDERILGKRVNEMATPYLPTIRAEGATVEKAFSDYLQTAHVLRSGTPQQKANSIAAVMQQFKVSPQDLFSIIQGSNVNTGVQGQPTQFDPRVETLQQRLDRIEQERNQEVQQRQLQEEHSLQSQIDGFSSDPGHEHFEKVRPYMGVLLSNGLAKDLEDAYQQAINADPEIRSSLQASNQQALNGKRLTELNAKTERAKSAAVSITGGPGSSRPLNGTGSIGSIEDDLRAALREHSGRV